MPPSEELPICHTFLGHGYSIQLGDGNSLNAEAANKWASRGEK